MVVIYVNRTRHTVYGKNNQPLFSIERFEPRDKNQHKTISMNQVQQWYSEKLNLDEDPRTFSIKAMAIDGTKTLKSEQFTDDELKFYSESEYFQELPDNAKEKFKRYFYVEFMYRL